MIKTCFIAVVFVVGCSAFSSELPPTPPLPRLPSDDLVHKWGQYDDIRLSPEQALALKWRLPIRGERYRWRNNTVWYTIAKYPFSANELKEMYESFRDFEQETCLKFRPAGVNTPNYIVVRQGTGGCNSLVGQAYNEPSGQAVNLANGCRFYGLYRHEFGHAVGFHHEHQNPKRDRYVDIIKDNVEPEMRQWFDPVPSNEFDDFGIDYDMQSNMHYEDTAFSKQGPNGESYTTIRVKDPRHQKFLGRVYLKDFSFLDIKKINLMYKCANHCPKNIACPGTTGFIDKNCKCVTEEEFANRRCFDVRDRNYCQSNKSSCFQWYDVHVNCRKTCGHCFVPYNKA